MTQPGGHRWARWGWTLYDLANTLFSFVILSFYYGPWLTKGLGAPDSYATLPASASMLVVMVLSPLLGALADRTRRIPFLVVSTVVAVVATALLGVGSFLALPASTTIALAVLFFFLANLAYQLGLVFYDALLPVVSTPPTLGRVGAIGVAVGYGGSLIGLALGALLVKEDAGGVARGQPLLFVVVAVAFLVIALPCFLFVREARKTPPPGVVRDAARGTIASLRSLRRDPAMLRFLVGRLLYADVANTTLLILGIYVVNEMGYSEGDWEYKVILLSGIVFAILAAPLWGKLVDSRGPKRALMAVLGTWAGTLALVVATPLLDLPPALFFVAGAGIGISLAGTWSADRPLLVSLAPAHKVGEWFGLYAMAGRFAAVVGPALYAFTVDFALRGSPYARPVAVATFIVMVLASWAILRKLPDR